MRHALALSLALLLVPVAASAGFLQEHSIRARALDGYGGPDLGVAFDGVHYVMVYTDLRQLRVQHIDESGALAGDSQEFDNAASASLLALASGNGISLVSWANGYLPQPRFAWVADGVPMPSFTLKGANTIAAVGDHFLAAWSDNSGVYVSRVEPFATSFTSTYKVADSGFPGNIAVAGNDILFGWSTWDNSQPCGLPEGCPVAVPHARMLTADGAPSGDELAWPPLSDAPMPSNADSLFLVGSSTILARSGNSLQHWTVPNALSIARLSGKLYASTNRRIYRDGLWPGMPYFGAVGTSGALDREYRITGAMCDCGGTFYPSLTAGSRSLLAWYRGPMGSNAIEYRIIDPQTPFPALPSAPTALSVSLSPTDLKATLQWSATDPVTEYFVEVQPLSDPTAWTFLGAVPAGVNVGIINTLPNDVLYAMRVYGSTADGLSKPVESILRTPPAAIPRAATDFTATVDGGVATFRWRDVSTNESGFRIVAMNLSWIRHTVADLPANTTEAKVALLPGWNVYTLESYNAAGSNATWNVQYLSAPAPRLRAVGR